MITLNGLISPTILVIAAIALGGCGVRPISYTGHGHSMYAGELSQIDVLRSLSAPDAGAAHTQVGFKAGERVMVIQSGQLVPDHPLMDALAKDYSLTPVSGIPSRSGMDGVPLRLAARAGGVAKVVVYWGGIETKVTNHTTKAVSWVPVLGGFVPDETQSMRIALTVILADVERGVWDQIVVASQETTVQSAMFWRSSADHRQISELKAEVYARLAATIAARR